jgi:hypothetical protein
MQAANEQAPPAEKGTAPSKPSSPLPEKEDLLSPIKRIGARLAEIEARFGRAFKPDGTRSREKASYLAWKKRAFEDQEWLIGQFEELLKSYRAAMDLVYGLQELAGIQQKRIIELEAQALAQPREAFQKTEGGIYVPD